MMMIKLISLIICGIVLSWPSTATAHSKSNNEYVIQTKIIKSPVGSLSFVSSQLKLKANACPAKSQPNSTPDILKLSAKLKKMIADGATTQEMEKLIKNSMGEKDVASVSISVKKKKENSTILTSETSPKGKGELDAINANKNLKIISEILKKQNLPISINKVENRYVMRWNDPKSAQDSTFSINPINGSFSVPFGSGTVELNGLKLTMKDNELFWNGLKTPPATSGISVIDCPDLKLSESKTSTAMMISPTEYFVENAPGQYIVKKIPAKNSPGIIMKVVATPTKTTSIQLKLSLKLNVLKKRESLRGTTLKVGKPVIISNAFTQKLMTKPGNWILTCGYAITEKSQKNTNQIYLIQRVLKTVNSEQ